MQRGVFVVQYTLWGDIVPRLCRVACIASAAFPAPTGGAAFLFTIDGMNYLISVFLDTINSLFVRKALVLQLTDKTVARKRRKF